MRLLITGDRYFTDYQRVYDAIRALAPDVVIHGAAPGADTLADQAATELGIPVAPYRADWNRYKRAAGPIRNRQMLVEGVPDLVLAFHDDLPNSKGTADMIRQATKAGIEVRYG